MKVRHITCFLLSALAGTFVSCTGSHEIKMTGSVKNLDGGTILYQKSIDGMFNSQAEDTLRLNADSTFSLTFPSNGYEQIRLSLRGKRYLGSFIADGGNYRLQIDAAATHPISILEGKNEKNMEVSRLMDELGQDVLDVLSRKGDKWGITQDTLAVSVSKKLQDAVLALDEKIKGVDKDLYEKACQNTRIQAMRTFQNQLFGITYRCSESTKQSWLKEWEKMMEFCRVNHPASTFSIGFDEVVYNNAGITYYTKEEPASEDLKKNPNKLIFHYIEKSLTGQAQESAMALLFLKDAHKEKYDPEILPLEERFKQLYPQSKWQPLIDKAIAKNKAFNQAKIPDNIHFPNIDNAKTFKDITDLYKGKVIFIDMWATWCGPCRASFAYVKPLQEYAKANDIVLLYLSIDRPEEDAKWRKMAAHYDLIGEHVRMQEAFKDEIYTTFGNEQRVLSVPHYVIIGKDGEIKFKSAASPKNMEKLKSQLKEAAQAGHNSYCY